MYCVKCGCKLKDSDIYCCLCGNKVATEEKNIQPAKQPVKVFNNKCEGCGAVLKMLQKGRYLCDYCGSEYFVENDGDVTQSKVSEKEIMDVFYRAAQFEARDKYYEELSCLLSLSEKAADNVMVLVKIGRAYRHNDMYEKAIEYYQKAIAVNPQYPMSYTNLGAVYILINNPERALGYLRTGIQLMNANRSSCSDDDYAIAHSNYALAAGKMGRKDEAERFLEIAEKNGYPNGNAVRRKIGLKQSFWKLF